MIVLATDKVHEDEPCISLKEMNQPSPLGGRHRYQIIRVLRGDRIYEFQRDLGESSKYGVVEFVIPGAGYDNIPVERVGDLVEIANYVRAEKPRCPEKPIQDLLDGYYEIREKQLKA